MTYLPPIINYLPRLWFNTSLGVLSVYYFDLPISVLLCFFAFEIAVILLYTTLQLNQHLHTSRTGLITVTSFGLAAAGAVCMFLLPSFITEFRDGGLQAAAMLTPFASTLAAHTYLVTSHHLSEKLQRSFPARTGYVLGIFVAGVALVTLLTTLLDTSYHFEFQLSLYVIFKYTIDITLFTILR